MHKSFGNVVAVEALSLRFQSSRITAIVGPNGAGKTTLFDLLVGAARPDRGEILLDGRNIVGLAPWQVARAGVGRLFQDVRVFKRLSVLDNVLVGFAGQSGEQPLRALFRGARYEREQVAAREQAMNWLERFRLAPLANALVSELSYGEQKLVALARLLVSEPRVLLLDEPAAGLTPLILEVLADTLRSLASAGLTVVVIEHDLDFVLRRADRVECMSGGRVLAGGVPDEVLSDSSVRRAFLGL